ncbi:MAG: glycosyltransferase family 39 protein [Bacteroidales bacterium]|nr:glycosyltransferase family 39 protein [Bacteroidales bacterium]
MRNNARLSFSKSWFSFYTFADMPDKKYRKDAVIVLILLVAGATVYLPFLGRVHLFDWDEANFAEAAREMVVTGNYSTIQINYTPFWEKPPLYIWMQAASMKAFGINEFAARLPNALCGMLTLVVLFLAGRSIAGRRFGILWSVSFGASILPFFYFKSGIIDPWFNLFIFLSVFFIIRAGAERRQPFSYLMGGLFAGCAMLTKGPVGLLLIILTWIIFLLFNRFRHLPHLKHIVLFTVMLVISGGSWFIAELLQGRTHIIADFIQYQIRLAGTADAGHAGFPLFHFVVVFMGCFPASVLALLPLLKSRHTPEHLRIFRLWMVILFWVVMIIFSLVRTKIVHYSSMTWFPLSFLSAIMLERMIAEPGATPGWIRKIILITGIIWAIMLALPPLLLMNRDWLLNTSLIRDDFTRGCLEANVRWSGLESLAGIIFPATLYLFFQFRIKRAREAVIMLFSGIVVATIMALVFYVPRIEAHTQRAAIEFYRSKQGMDCLVQTLGFKSYAYLFYSARPPQPDERHTDLKWLFHGDISRPVYFVVRITEAARHEEWLPHLEKTGSSNGYVFYVRHPGVY